MTYIAGTLFYLSQLPDRAVELYEQIDNDTPQFDGFSKLTSEVRQEIWKMSIPKGRIITVDVMTNMNIIIRTKEPTPVIFHVNRESRNVALSIYNVVYPMKSLIPIYYRSDFDILLFHRIPSHTFTCQYRRRNSYKNYYAQELEDIKHIALKSITAFDLELWLEADEDLYSGFPCWLHSYLHRHAPCFTHFPGLKTIRWIVKHKDRSSILPLRDEISYWEEARRLALEEDPMMPNYKISAVLMADVRADTAAGTL